MNNAYGLDADYFTRLCAREFNPDVIRNQNPEDLARAFARAARTACAEVLDEPEFSGALAADNQRLREALEKIKFRADCFVEDGADMQPHSAEVISGIARAALAGSKKGE